MIFTHLRSTARPEAYRRRNGAIKVHTECGRIENSVFVDNEHADCPACLRVDVALATPSTGPCGSPTSTSTTTFVFDGDDDVERVGR